jgi:plasmid stabilization system protein ParE
MRSVFWSGDSLADLDSAVRYIAKDSPRSATLVVDRIKETIDLLAEFPSGRLGRVKGTYEKPVHRTLYTVAYSMSDRRLMVLRIIHGSRDWPESEWPAE